MNVCSAQQQNSDLMFPTTVDHVTRESVHVSITSCFLLLFLLLLHLNPPPTPAILFPSGAAQWLIEVEALLETLHRYYPTN